PGIILDLIEVVHWNVVLFGIETDRQNLDALRASPSDSHDSVFDLTCDSPFLNADGHSGLLDDCRLIFSGELRHALLLSSRGIFLHLGSGFRLFAYKRDLIHPLDAGAAIPAGHHKANGSAMIFR